MALITCPECGREVSDLSPNCPNCGRPIATPAAGFGKRRSRGPIIAVGIIVALLVAMFISCPNEDDHRREVQIVGEKTVKLLAEKQDNAIVSGLATLFGGNIIKMMVSELLDVDNYGIVSIGRLNNTTKDGGSSIISVGILGHVFTASPEQLVSKMGDKLNSAKDQLTNDLKEGIDQEIDNAIDGALNSIDNSIKEGLEDIDKLTDIDPGNTLDEDLMEDDDDDYED